jgi:hypothetical protein
LPRSLKHTPDPPSPCTRPQAEREQREAERRARKDADRKAIADLMERNYLDFHTKVGVLVVLKNTGLCGGGP